MSRTDVHRPNWVQMLDPTIRHWFKDWHHHAHGSCDLEEYLAQITSTWGRTNCYRQQSAQAPNLCGCDLCTWSIGRRLQRRQERVLWRRVRQDLLKTLPQDYEDLDVPPLHGSSY